MAEIITVTTGGGGGGTGTVTSVNNVQPVSGNVTLTATNVGAAATTHTHVKTDITDFPTLGEAAGKNVGTGANDVAAGNHSHDATAVTFSAPDGFPNSPAASNVAQALSNLKGYSDALVQGLNIKAAVKASTTGNITLSGEQTLDGISCVAGDRVLVRFQTNQTQNGIYIVRAGASPAWTRAEDFDAPAEARGAFVFVQQGTTWADTGWVVTSDSISTIGTDNIVWTQFSAAGVITNGTGLSKTSNAGGQTTVALQTAYATTSGTAPNYSLTITNYPSTLPALEGYSIKFKAHASGSGTIQVNVNGTGFKEIRTSDNVNVNSLTINSVYTIVWNSNTTTGNFILQGEGGEINTSSKTLKTIKVDEAVNRGDVIEGYYRDYSTGFNGNAFSTASITNSGSVPTNGAPGVVAWSPNGVYLAVGYSQTPFLAIFKRSGDTITRLAASTFVSGGPASEPLSMTWSQDSSSLIVCFATTPFIYHYKRYSGDYFFRDGMTNPGNPTVVALDPTNTYCLAATNVNPFIRVLKRNTQDFNLLATSAIVNAASSTPKSITWHPNGTIYALVYNQSASGLSLNVNKKDSGVDTFTGFATFDTSSLNIVWPPSESDAPKVPYACRFSPAGNYLAFLCRVESTTNYGKLLIYNFDENFSYVNAILPIINLNITGTPTNYYENIAWSPDGKYILISGTLVTPALYKFHNNTLTAMDTQGTSTTSYRFTDFIADGTYVATARSDSGGVNAFPEIRKVVPANAPYLFVKPSNTTRHETPIGTFDKVYAIARQAGTAGGNISASVIIGSTNTP